jgi:hypothetical protein
MIRRKPAATAPRLGGGPTVTRDGEPCAGRIEGVVVRYQAQK